MTAYLRTGSPRIYQLEILCPQSRLLSRARAQPAKRNDRAMGRECIATIKVKIQLVSELFWVYIPAKNYILLYDGEVRVYKFIDQVTNTLM